MWTTEVSYRADVQISYKEMKEEERYYKQKDHETLFTHIFIYTIHVCLLQPNRQTHGQILYRIDVH